MKVYLKSLTGKGLQLDVDPNSTIRSLMDKSGRVPGGTRLMFERMSLNDDCTLAQCNIRDGAELTMVKAHTALLVEDHRGEVLYIRAGVNDTVGQVKTKIAGFGSTQQNTVHDVTLRTEWNYPVEQYTGTAIAKQPTAKHTKPEGMRLYIQNGEKYQELEDESLMSQYTVIDNTVLYLVCYRWSNRYILQSKKTKEEIPIIGVEHGDTALSIKLRIQEQHGIPVGEQRSGKWTLNRIPENHSRCKLGEEFAL